MPGLPEIDVPSVQAEAQPAPVEPIAPLGAFAGAHVGAAFDKTGEALFGVGLDAYHRAAEADAQEKETAFQKTALDLRDKYRGLYTKDAIGAHAQYTQALEKARDEIGKGLSSKYGASIYANNSLRNMRLVQESIDSHFEQQNERHQQTTYSDAQKVSTRMLASLAKGAGFNPEAVEAKVKELHDRAVSFAKGRGASDEEAETHAQKELGVSMDAYFDVLTSKDSGRNAAEVRAEYEKWNAAGFLDKHVQQKAGVSMVAQEARGAVRQIFAATPRLVNDPKFDGSPDPDGEPDFAAMLRQKDAYVEAHPEQEEIVNHEFNALRAQVDTAFTQEVKRRVDRVMALAREDQRKTGGELHADPTSRDYLWLMRNKATALDVVGRAEYRADQLVNKDAFEHNEQKFKGDLIALSKSDPAKFESLTEADLFKMQEDRRYAGGFSSRFRLEEAGKVYKGLKEQHQKGELQWIEKTTQAYLKGNIYTGAGDVDRVRAGELHDALAGELQAALRAGTVKSGDWKSVNDFLKAETAKVGASTFLGAKVGGEFKAVLDARNRAKPPAAAPVQVGSPAPGADRLIPVRGGVWNATKNAWDKEPKE